MTLYSETLDLHFTSLSQSCPVIRRKSSPKYSTSHMIGRIVGSLCQPVDCCRIRLVFGLRLGSAVQLMTFIYKTISILLYTTLLIHLSLSATKPRAVVDSVRGLYTSLRVMKYTILGFAPIHAGLDYVHTPIVNLA